MICIKIRRRPKIASHWGDAEHFIFGCPASDRQTRRLRNDSSSRTYNDPPGETEAGNEVTVGAEDVVLAVRDYGRGIPEDIETYLAETVLEYG
jgi:hypothetical protein